MYWVTVVILVIYLVLVFVLGRLLPLHGSDVWILRGALAFLGLIGAAVAFWYQHKMKKAKEAAGEDESQSSSADDLDGLVREAIRRLRQSTLGRGSNLGSLPLVYILGNSGSTKTTVLIHSALDPELLAGQVYRDNDVLPTGSANLWYTRQAIFVDPAGSMMADAIRWKRLVKLLQPARFSAAFGKKTQAPRAAIVCFDCETFLQPGASESSISSARRMSTRLQEVSQLLGISFPVYVLFTRLDRVSFFTEFVRGMSKDEVAEVLGATLPLRSVSAGVYADEETRRLTKAFDEIFYSLADRRIVLLPRENDADKLPAIYEFPREMKKLRTLLVQFLVDLARPSQLGTNPFLRGFYFTGVRPIVVDDVVAAPLAALEAQEQDPGGGGATQIFRSVGSQAAQMPVAPRGVGPRRMPQWCFLTSLFNDVLVKDRVALAASGSSSHVNLLRRIALGAALFVVLVFVTGFAVSFFRNHALESRVHEDIAALKTLQITPTQPATVDDLRKLDNLRGELVDLSDWEANGAPWGMRWGLYTGHEVYEDAMPFYFDRFNRLLFAETQKRIIDSMSVLPDNPPPNAPNDAYLKTYNELKAYLITTSYHEKSTSAFLTPVLMTHWVAGRDIDKDRRDLATNQFDFYATELAKKNWLGSGNSPTLITHTQAYLKGFTGLDRFYGQLLAKVPNSREQSFNDAYPDSVGVISSGHKVRGAFTRSGYQFVQQALLNPSDMGGEEWVLGPAAAQGVDQAALRQNLTARYNQDFVNEWNTVLRTSSFTGYSGYPDADKKLQKLTDPASPQMELLYFISHNVDVASQDVKQPFAPVQAVEDPGPADKPPAKYIGKATEDYVKALGNLQAAIHGLAQSPGGTPDPALLAAAGTAEGAASTAVTSVITSVPVDSQFANEKQVRRVLEEPITAIDTMLRRGPQDIANGSGKGFCTAFNDLTSKYPFNPNSLQDLPVDQLYSVFAGDAWKKFTDGIKPFVLRVGSGYAENPTAPVKPSVYFLRFLNHMQALSDLLYPAGSQPPHFSYTLKALPSNLEGVEVKIGDKKLAGEGAQETFVWTGAPDNVDVSKNGDTLDSANGAWAVFKFISRAHHLSGNNLEWVIQNNDKPVILPNGKVKSYDFQLQVSGGANPFFDLPGMKCVSQVAGR
jgi:type VI secretion system protein ImpL